jgi:hypothetical protein
VAVVAVAAAIRRQAAVEEPVAVEVVAEATRRQAAVAVQVEEATA